MRRILTILMTAALVLTGALTNAGPASAAVTWLAHYCKVLEGGNGYEAVHCATLYYDSWNIYGGNSVVCRTEQDKFIVACGGIKEQPILSAGTSVIRGVAGSCGAVYGHSACRADTIINYTKAVYGCGKSARAGTFDTEVILPGDVKLGGPGTSIFTTWATVPC